MSDVRRCVHKLGDHQVGALHRNNICITFMTSQRLLDGDLRHCWIIQEGVCHQHIGPFELAIRSMQVLKAAIRTLLSMHCTQVRLLETSLALMSLQCSTHAETDKH